MIINFFKWQIEIKKRDVKSPVLPTPPVKKVQNPQLELLRTARASIGKNFCMNLEYGSAETINALVEIATGKPLGGGVSTSMIHYFLHNDIFRFKPHQEGAPLVGGEIVISPTGSGKNKEDIGNVGVIDAEAEKIICNDPLTGKVEALMTFKDWQEKYHSFPISVYDLI